MGEWNISRHHSHQESPGGGFPGIYGGKEPARLVVLLESALTNSFQPETLIQDLYDSFINSDQGDSKCTREPYDEETYNSFYHRLHRDMCFCEYSPEAQMEGGRKVLEKLNRPFDQSHRAYIRSVFNLNDTNKKDKENTRERIPLEKFLNFFKEAEFVELFLFLLDCTCCRSAGGVPRLVWDLFRVLFDGSNNHPFPNAQEKNFVARQGYEKLADMVVRFGDRYPHIKSMVSKLFWLFDYKTMVRTRTDCPSVFSLWLHAMPARFRVSIYPGFKQKVDILKELVELALPDSNLSNLERAKQELVWIVNNGNFTSEELLQQKDIDDSLGFLGIGDLKINYVGLKIVDDCWKRFDRVWNLFREWKRNGFLGVVWRDPVRMNDRLVLMKWLEERISQPDIRLEFEDYLCLDACALEDRNRRLNPVVAIINGNGRLRVSTLRNILSKNRIDPLLFHNVDYKKIAEESFQYKWTEELGKFYKTSVEYFENLDDLRRSASYYSSVVTLYDNREALKKLFEKFNEGRKSLELNELKLPEFINERVVIKPLGKDEVIGRIIQESEYKMEFVVIEQLIELSKDSSGWFDLYKKLSPLWTRMNRSIVERRHSLPFQRDILGALERVFYVLQIFSTCESQNDVIMKVNDFFTESILSHFKSDIETVSDTRRKSLLLSWYEMAGQGSTDVTEQVEQWENYISDEKINYVIVIDYRQKKEGDLVVINEENGQIVDNRQQIDEGLIACGSALASDSSNETVDEGVKERFEKLRRMFKLTFDIHSIYTELRAMHFPFPPVNESEDTQSIDCSAKQVNKPDTVIIVHLSTLKKMDLSSLDVMRTNLTSYEEKWKSFCCMDHGKNGKVKPDPRLWFTLPQLRYLCSIVPRYVKKKNQGDLLSIKNLFVVFFGSSEGVEESLNDVVEAHEIVENNDVEHIDLCDAFFVEFRLRQHFPESQLNFLRDAVWSFVENKKGNGFTEEGDIEDIKNVFEVFYGNSIGVEESLNKVAERFESDAGTKKICLCRKFFSEFQEHQNAEAWFTLPQLQNLYTAVPRYIRNEKDGRPDDQGDLAFVKSIFNEFYGKPAFVEESLRGIVEGLKSGQQPEKNEIRICRDFFVNFKARQHFAEWSANPRLKNLTSTISRFVNIVKSKKEDGKREIDCIKDVFENYYGTSAGVEESLDRLLTESCGNNEEYLSLCFLSGFQSLHLVTESDRYRPTLYVKKEDDQLFEIDQWDTILNASNNGIPLKNASVCFECSQYTTTHNVRHFLNRVSAFPHQGPFFVFNAETLSDPVKKVLGTVENIHMFLNVFDFGKVPLEGFENSTVYLETKKGKAPEVEKLMVAKPLPAATAAAATAEEPKKEEEKDVKKEEHVNPDVQFAFFIETGVNVVIVTGEKSHGVKSCGKSHYVKYELAKEKEYVVFPVNEAFSVSTVVKRIRKLKKMSQSTGCVVHFKVTPFCDMPRFNEFLRILFVRNMFYNYADGSLVPFEMPCKDTTFVFEIEEGDGEVDLSIERLPALLWIRAKYIDRVKEKTIRTTMHDVRKIIFDDLDVFEETVKEGDAERVVKRHNKDLFQKAHLQFPDFTDCRVWYYPEGTSVAKKPNKIGIKNPTKCAFHKPYQPFNDRGVCETCGRDRQEVVWRLLCSTFGVSSNLHTKIKNMVERDLHFVMDRKTALRILYLNELIQRKQPILIQGDTGTGKSEMMRVFSRLLNSHSAFDYYEYTMKHDFFEKFFGDKCFVSTGDDVDSVLKKVEMYYKNKEHLKDAGEFCAQVFNFLKKESEDKPFYEFNRLVNDKSLDSSRYRKEFDKNQSIEFALSDLKEYAETKLDFFHHVVMDTHMTEELLKNELNVLRKRIRVFNEKMNERNESVRFVLFIDECTSTNLMGLVKEIIIDHSFKGKPLPDELVVIGAYNKNNVSETLSMQNFVVYDQSDPSNSRRTLEFAVRPPPKSFYPFELSYTFEPDISELKDLIRNMLDHAFFYKPINKLLIPDKEGKTEDKIRRATCLLAAAFSVFNRIKFVRVHSSIRDIARSVRFTLFFLFFFTPLKHGTIGENAFDECSVLKEKKMLFPMIQLKETRFKALSNDPADFRHRDWRDNWEEHDIDYCVLSSLYLCYYLRLQGNLTPDLTRSTFYGTLLSECARKAFLGRRLTNDIKTIIMDFDPDKVGGRQQMQKLTQDIAWRLCDNLHDSSLKYIRLFSENFFALVCSLHAGVPVLIEGPPGCSKTFTWNVVRRCFSGDVVDGIEASRIQQMVVQSITVQCSKQTTDTDVKRGFKELENLKKKSKEHNKDEHNSNIVCTIVLDEASLVDNEEAPLKTLHQQLDYCIISNEEQNNRPCVILSNNILDAAKTSRVILVAQSALDCDPSIDDPNPELMELIDDRFTEDEKRRIARVYGYANKFYAKYCSTDWNKYFYHLRDLVFFQRELADKLDNSKGGLLSDDNKERVFRILTRQFGGMPADAYSKLMEVLYPSGNFVPNPSMIYDEMKKQLINPETRYRNYLIIDDTESGIPLTLMKNLLGNKLRHCYVTDFSADTGDQIQQDAIKTVVSAMHGGQKVVITNIVPVSSAFFTLFNLETESNDGGEKRVVYANIAIGPVLYPYLLKEGFSIIVYMTRSELKNAPTALLNRFQKILFTGNGFVDYVECTLNLDKSVRSKISKCKRSCRQLVDSCGRKMFSGYSERNTVSTALINSLTDHGGFLCPQPYERLFASSTDAPEQNNITNTLHMLMLVARSNILHQSAFFLDDSLKRAFERLQQHNTVVRFIRFLKNNQHCPDVCWNVLTEKCMTLSYSRYTLQESLKKSLGSGSRIEVLSLSGEKRDDFDKAVSQAFEGCASFVVCLADMSLCSASNVNYARRLLEDKIEAKKRRPFVIFVQMFPSSQLYDIEKYCSAFFFPWRCTFIEKLFDDKHSESKGLEEKESSLITTMKCEGPLFDVWNSFDEKQKEVFSYDSVKNKRFCEEEKEEEKTLCECSLDDIYSFFLMKPQADRSQESVCLLDLLRETGSEQMTKRQTIRTICCEKEFIIHPRIDFAFGGWEKSDLCCMLKHWCLQSVEEENRFWNDFSPLYDVLAEIAKSKECESRNPARGRCLLGLHKKIQEQPQLKQLKQQELRDLLLEKASKDTVRLLDVIKDFAKYQSYYSVSLRVFCEERGFVTEDRVTNLLGGWTMDELYCLVVFWCQRHVHNEEKFFSRAERECSKCIDGLSEEQKRILGIVVEEFRSIMQSGLFLNGENDVILRLREAQKCCRIDDRINWELMFDDTVCSLKGVEEYLLPSVPPNDPSNFLYLNKVLFFPIRCCIFGLRHYKKYIQLKFSDMDDERKRRSYCSSEVSRNPVLSLIFMRPNFSCLLDTEEAENRVW